MEAIQKTEIEQIQQESESPEVQVEMRPDVSGAQTLHAALDDVASDFSVGGFKCAHDQCGLVHQHDTTKHRASDDFSMSDDEAAEMEFNPNCHCALNELSRKGVDGAPTPSQANSMAPVPDTVSRTLDKMY